MDILRILTAGSVDDGKSTLIGRLLYDSQSILVDHLEALERASKKDGQLDFSLLTDGLRAEREQGITIDVAYRYFNTNRRKFIIADSPGHVQYTRNMVTGASNSDLALILIDARNGVIEQTRRHSYICYMLGLPHFLVCINKMDLVDYSKETYDKIVADYKEIVKDLGIEDLHFIPISALQGDNIVHQSATMPWYEGKPLLQMLENVEVQDDTNYDLPRFMVQWVIRPQSDEYHDYRGYAGRIQSGAFKKGDKIKIHPEGLESTITKIEADLEEVEEAFAPMSVVIHLDDDIDISRGNSFTSAENGPMLLQNLRTRLCWMHDKPLKVGGKYLLQQHSRRVKCIVRNLLHTTNVNTMETDEFAEGMSLNDLGQIHLKTAEPLAVDSYEVNPDNGSFILIDEATNNTVAAGMVMGEIE